MTPEELATSDDYRALLRTVLTDPAADLPRLVLADFLEENGDGDRAEFIRLGVGVTGLRRTLAAVAAAGVRVTWDHPVSEDSRRDRDRAIRLRLAHPEWRADLAPDAVADGLDRGFVSAVTLTPAAFVAHAAALFSRHPVTAVTLAGVSPAGAGLGEQRRYHLYRQDLPPVGPPDRHGYDYATWAQATLGYVDSRIPRRTRGGGVAARQNCGYRSREAALAALSWDCVCLGRDLAGLPPIPAPPAPACDNRGT